jgi:ADP-ribose pyrophosphatase YjhB (NUDIX family)
MAGEEHNKQGLTEAEFLAGYDPDRYQKPSVTVDMLILTVGDRNESNYRKLPEKELKLLMVKRGNHPFIGKWGLPGGFVEIDESLGEAAVRELTEETGLKDIYLEQLYTWGDVARDPRMRVISASYMALANDPSLEVRAGDDASDARWFSATSTVLSDRTEYAPDGFVDERMISLKLENSEIRLTSLLRETRTVHGRRLSRKLDIVESDGIAFDHARIIEYGLERLRSKIEYTDIAFSLMPELFTLTELQRVYEIILGEELLTANFRRKIQPMVIETNEIRRAAGHRPAALYRFNPNWEQRS